MLIQVILVKVIGKMQTKVITQVQLDTLDLLSGFYVEAQAFLDMLMRVVAFKQVVVFIEVI